MYLVIPFSLIVASIIGITVIIYRKMPYLKKLTPESHEVNGNLFESFFPEFASHIDQAKIKEYKKNFLLELEKLVRRMRVVTLRMDHLSEKVIKSLRRGHLTAHMEHRALMDEKTPEAVIVPEKLEPTQEDYKAQEQKIIIEIAQNPRDPALYDKLGDLYIAMHNIDEAKESFEAALALNPNDLALARKYSQIIKKTGLAS